MRRICKGYGRIDYMRTLMKIFGRLVLFAVAIILAAIVLLHQRPVWVALQKVHAELFMARVQSNYVATSEGRAHYYEAEAPIPGGGIPLVLVHGLADRGESWAPMLIRLKRAGFHVYAPDLLGSGRSPHPADSDYSIATQEKFVTDFIQALGLQKTDLGGWSMGGWIVLKLAVDHPELVDRVVVYDSVGIHAGPTHVGTLFHPTNAQDLQHLFSLLEPHSAPIPAFASKDFLRVMAKNQWVVDRSVQSMESGKDAIDDALPKLTEPLLIVWGSDDQLLPLSMGQQFHALDPASEMDVIQGCGHLAPKTCAARVAMATADFLKAQTAPSGSVRTLTSMR
jgi:pimeloyl-ACP methyl ester carboxylesterase